MRSEKFIEDINHYDKIGFVSHDAGGAEILSSIAMRIKSQIFALTTGPAINIYKRKISNSYILTLEKIPSLDLLITSTSWKSKLEIDAILIAKNHGIRTITYLDHWINYRSRFMDNAKNYILPDEIWVGDKYALKLAQKCFPDVDIISRSNLYLADIKDEYNNLFLSCKIQPHSQYDMLYVSEPIDKMCKSLYNNERYYGYTQHDAIDYMLKCLSKSKKKYRVLLRRHPSEKESIFTNLLKNRVNHDLTISNGTSLLEDLIQSKAVVGCQSMALIVGLECNMSAYTCIPPQLGTCQLPHTEIHLLEQFVNI